VAEKRTSHHDLDAIKRAFSGGKGLYTQTAIRDAAALGYGKDEIKAAIQTMAKNQLYKSMTSNFNASIWQDVYHVPHDAKTLYVKFTDNGSVTEFTLLSFKEK
jgi:motility quorum-sensing regulator / GCU-specific mRNA interferase toxin